MVWISETHRLNCRMSDCWNSNAMTHSQSLVFLHYSRRSFFFILFCTFWSCWAICNTDACLHMRSRTLMISLLVFKDLLNLPYCMQNHQTLWAILQTTARKHNFRHKLTCSCTHIHVYICLYLHFWGLFLVKGNYFSFILSVMPY